MAIRNFSEKSLTAEVLKRVGSAPDKRTRQVMRSLVKHLHAFVREARPTQEEWFQGIQFLTQTGHLCDDKRQEFILMSDTLGVSMLVDFINYGKAGKATESTVLGPFFVEGAGYFGIGGFQCYFCSNVSSLSMLNTRRIGRAPQMSAMRDSVAYADEPDNTRIIGALKLTGRTPSAFSIGVLNSLTAREEAPVAFGSGTGPQGERIVEPMTNYFAGRVAKDLRGGATVVKLMATSVYRNLDDPYLVERLSRNSEALGLSTEMWWKKRTYRLMAQLAGTHLAGDTAAVRRVKSSRSVNG